MAGFDPDMSKEAMVQGFTSCDPDDLPSEIPSRSRCDSIDGKREVTGAMRNANFASMSKGETISAYKSSQFGTTPEGEDAEDDNIPDVGNYKKNGQ